MFAIVLIKEINSLFAMGIFYKENLTFIDGSVSRLMFCYHSMIYNALNLNNISVGTPQAICGMNQKSLERIALTLVCRLLDKNFLYHFSPSISKELIELFDRPKDKFIQPVGDLVDTG